MDPATAIQTILFAKAIIDGIVANAAAANGYSDEDKAKILTAAGISDQNFDNAAAAAQARIDARNAGGN